MTDDDIITELKYMVYQMDHDWEDVNAYFLHVLTTTVNYKHIKKELDEFMEWKSNVQ